MKRVSGVLGFLVLAFCLALPGFAQYGSGRTSLTIPATEAPYVTLDGVSATYGPATLLTVNYTAGKIYLGDTAVSVAAGQVSGLTASKATCNRPAYSACNIIYANSSGTVATTLVLATAQAAGNSVLAFAQTDTTKVTEIRYPWQDTGFPTISLSGALVLSTGAITPTQIAGTIATVGQAQTVTGIISGDSVRVVSHPVPTSLCPLVGAIASGTNEVTFYWSVLTAVACTPAAGTYKVLVTR